MPKEKYKPLSYRDKADLYMQLAQLEESGLPVDQALGLLRLPKSVQSRINRMRAQVSKGNALWQAGEQCGLFTSLEAQLICAAMKAGSPAATYARLASDCDDRARQLSVTKSRMMFPAGIFVLALLIQPLPSLIAGSISTAEFVWHVTRPLLLIALLVMMIRALLARTQSSSGKSWLQSVPLFGAMFVRKNLRDFFSTLGMMLEAGISMLEAVPIALNTITDGDIYRELSLVRPRIAAGASLHDALQGVGYINDSRLRQFIKTGEASGNLPDMLLRHARMETESINDFFEQLTTWTPRLVYALLVGWMAYELLVGSPSTLQEF